MGTNHGRIIQAVRFGDRVSPRSFEVPGKSMVQSIHFNPFLEDYFLGACSNGDVALFVPALPSLPPLPSLGERCSSFDCALCLMQTSAAIQ